MRKIKRICVVTGSRAEYGLLFWLLKKIDSSKSLKLQLIVTGLHLSAEFGLTYKQIEQDGFKIDKKVEMLLSSDTEVGINKSIGLGIIGFSEALSELKPDLLVLLGDRFEIFSAAVVAMVEKIPVAHLHGGELTEGVVDEAIRHSITKMSHLHFASTKEYRNRIIQMGEQPHRVFNVGAVGIDNIKKLKLLSKEDFEKSINFTLGNHNLLVTFHPVTLETSTTKKQFQNLLTTLDKLDDINIIFTKANADTDGRIINNMIDNFVSTHQSSSIAFTSLGQLKYLSTLQYVDGVVGNSSSGLLEVPSFSIGTINIGDRQRGRIKAESVIDCDPTVKSIKSAIEQLYSKAFQETLKNVVNPYGDGETSEKVCAIIEGYPLNNILKKNFHDQLILGKDL